MLGKLVRSTTGMILLVMGLISSGSLYALGLGELTLESSLNEPLSASIEILDFAGLDAEQVQIRMGSQQDFERANVVRESFLNNITFTPDFLPNGTAFIRLTTDASVVEPYLNFIVDIRWPSGRLMREYTVLLDLPAFSQNISPAPEPARVQAAAPRPTPAPARSQAQIQQQQAQQQAVQQESPQQAVQPVQQENQEAAPQAAQQAASAPESVPADESDEQEYYVVDEGDTLWEIALQNRPSSSVSVQQMMLAIQRANEDAFINNNINRILVGRVLRIPTSREISLIEQDAALTQVAIQNQQAGAQPLAFNSNSNAVGGVSQDELSVLTGDDGESALGADSDLTDTIQALENELALSEESLDRARLENEELNGRLAMLENEIEILQNIIAMEDDRIAQLQADLEQQALATEQAIAEAEQAAATLAEVNASEPVNENDSLSQIANLYQNPLIMGGSVVALILFVVGFLVWRRKSAEAEAEEYAFAGITDIEDGLDDSEEEFSAVDAEQEEEKPGLLTALRQRFSKSDVDGEVEDEDVHQDEEDEVALSESRDDDESGVADGAKKASILAGITAFFAGLKARSSKDSEEADDEDESPAMDAEEASDSEDSDLVQGFAEDSAEDFEDEDTLSADAGSESLAGNQEAEAEDEVDDADPLAAALDDADAALVDEGDAGLIENVEHDDELGSLLDSIDDEEPENAAEVDNIVNSVAQSGPEAAAAQEQSESELDSLVDSNNADSEQIVEEVSTSPVDESPLEFTIQDSPETEIDEPVDNSDDDEVFEFKLDDSAVVEEAVEPVDEESDEEVESFDFNLTEELPATAADKPEDEADDEVEVFDFSPDSLQAVPDVAEDDDVVEVIEEDDELDLGNLDLADFTQIDDEDEADPQAISGQRDESSTKLDLAVAYEAMGDLEGANEILDEVIAEGSAEQISEAERLKEKWKDS